MKTTLCDVCKERPASRGFQVKMRQKGGYDRMAASAIWNPFKWSSYESIDICGECAEKLLGMKYRGENGMSRPPGHK